ISIINNAPILKPIITPTGPASAIHVVGWTNAPHPIAEPKAIAQTQCGLSVFFSVCRSSMLFLLQIKFLSDVYSVEVYICQLPPCKINMITLSKPISPLLNQTYTTNTICIKVKSIIFYNESHYKFE